MTKSLDLPHNWPNAPQAALFPTSAERERLDGVLTTALLHAQERVAAGSVTPTLDQAAFRRELAAYDFATARPIEELLGWTIAQLEHGVVHMTHPRYFGLFNPSPTFPAQCADRITATFNPQLASAVTSPAATAIETHVIGAMARRAGLPAGSGGHFTGGGSEANATALICALTMANPQFAATGARAFAGPPVFYVSRDCHVAWLKIAHSAGIGRSSVRLVATEGHGRMDLRALAAMIAADRAAGSVPIMIAATAGTTNAGMIDPLAECAEIATANGLWYHVDAAWAGALLTSDPLRASLAGIGLADSITIDAHKWLATTMGCGMFLTKHAAILPAAFHVAANFMPPNDATLDPYVTSLQWSRRFLGLRLFLSLAAAGWNGYAKHVERSVDIARLIASQLKARDWRLLNNSPAAVLCLEPPAKLGTARAVVEQVVASGQAWVSTARFEGQDCVRICVTHGETAQEDVAKLVDALNGNHRDSPLI